MTFWRSVRVAEEGLEVWLSCRETGETTNFEVRSCAPCTGSHWLNDMTLHATGMLSPLGDAATSTRMEMPSGELRRWARKSAVSFGDHWRRLEAREVPGANPLLRVTLPDDLRSETRAYGLHPSMFDLVLGLGQQAYDGNRGVPSAIGEVRVYRSFPATVTAVATDVPNSGGAVSVVISDAHGQAVAEVADYLEVPRSAHRLAASPEQRLEVGDPGNLSTLELVPCDIADPSEGEIQIEVHAVGVLPTFFELSDDANYGKSTGIGYGGQVTAIGPGVESLAVGDQVVAIGEGEVATRVNVDACFVARAPETLSVEDGAGVLIPFLTAAYALNHVARLSKGERLLVHNASRGFGLAAVQIAAAAGAEVYATAASDEKRAYLRDRGLEHVFDSDAPHFVEEIREQTGGTGVDVVLDSSTAEFISAGIDLLRPHGMFLAVCGRDSDWRSDVGLRSFRNNLSFHAINLGSMIAERDALLVRVFGEVVDAFGHTRLSPTPVRAVPWENARQAMEHMAADRHIGSAVLVTRKASDRTRSGLTEEEAFGLEYSSSVSLQRGLEIFQELVQGADVPRHVIVSSRSLGSGGDTEAERDDDTPQKRRASTGAYRAPTNPTEERIVEIWEEVLAVESIGVDDDFLELGGDSISSIQILNRVRKVLGTGLPHDALLTFRTPALLSEAVGQHGARAYPLRLPR